MNTSQPTPMSDDELVNFCMEEVARGIGGIDSEESGEISLPLDYYFGKKPGLSAKTAKDPNSSRYVSMDLMDAIESTVAEIMPTFTTDEIGFYEPVDENDVERAREESALVNALFFEEYDGYTLLQVAVKDALLHRNCTVQAFWDEEASVEYKTYNNIPEMALPEVLKPTKENQKVEVIEQIIESEAEYIESPVGSVMVADTTYSIKVRRTTFEGRPVIESVPPEETIVNGDHNSPYLHNARFVARESVMTASSLIAHGVPKEIVDTLEQYTTNVDNQSRSRITEETDYNTAADDSVKLIRVFQCFPLIDFDGDGIAERRRVVISTNKLLFNEEFDSVSLIGGVASVMPHKYLGISFFDRLKDIQDAKTPVVRAIIDGTNLQARGRVGILTGAGVNYDDLLTSQTGGGVRMDNPNGVFELPSNTVPQSAYQMLDYMDSVRTDRGASAIDTSAQAQKVSGDTAHGIERVMSAMELNNAVIARSIGETLIRGIFIELHNILRENHKGQLTKNIGGQWITSSPSEWRKRTSVSIQIGSSQAERQRQASLLNRVVETQLMLKEQGSVMFDENKAYTAITDAVRMGGIKSPERYFVDPQSKEGQQAKQQQQQQSQQEKQKQDMMQQLMAKAQQDIADAEKMKGSASLLSQRVKAENDRLKNENAELQTMIDAAQKSDEMQYNYDKMYNDNAMKLTELEAEQQQDLSQQYRENEKQISED